VIKFAKPAAHVTALKFKDEDEALFSTTDLCIAAHHDDIEIMAFGPISACFDDPDRAFTGAVLSDGAGSPRGGVYGAFTDGQMKEIRVEEQLNAARIGGYAAQCFLAFTSSELKDAGNFAPVDDIEALLLATLPKRVYTHNLADKHDTHVAVALRTIEALRRLPAEKRPEKVYSMEVWRGLDWLCDSDKAVFDTSAHPHLAAALLGVYDSQINGGKRYDSAALGRRFANATFFESHATDKSDSISFALDITELTENPGLSPQEFISRYIRAFEREVEGRIEKFIRR
jgi:LmbE family N-acetylglucosaminyl deacetylase